MRHVAQASSCGVGTGLDGSAELSLGAADKSVRATSLILKFARKILAVCATVLVGGLLTAAMVRMSPGFDSDERLLDSRLDADSLAAVRAEHAANSNVLVFYWHHLTAMFHGDLGDSRSLRRPIAELISDRLPVTAELMAIGVIGGWTLAFALALPAVLSRSKIAGIFSTCMLCMPPAAVAVLIFTWGGPVRIIVALVLFPRLFDYCRNLLEDAYARPHILMARAKGLGPVRILMHHVLPVSAPQFLALAGISVSMAFGACIPVETLCDLPGIGQLAWKAAIARDLPVLVSLTMMITVLTQVCNSASDGATA
jgi:peptide/nickel transport system permease protein